MIAASPRGAALVLSPRSAGRLSWRKALSSDGGIGIVLLVVPRTMFNTPVPPAQIPPLFYVKIFIIPSIY
jgi:hypothetical protein